MVQEGGSLPSFGLEVDLEERVCDLVSGLTGEDEHRVSSDGDGKIT